MSAERYTRIEKDENAYRFQSRGKAVIVKVVQITPIKGRPGVYNLALQDEMEDGRLSDSNRTNNGDMPKVLATVEYIVRRHLDQHPDHTIFFHGSGSDGVRNRLYQMAIRANYELLAERYIIWGLTGKGWELYESGINYNGFLTRRRAN
jgi:hypothetical protein